MSNQADHQIRCVAEAIVEAHPVMKDKESEEFKTLMELKSKFIGCNGGKNANTIVAAILRTLTSRKVSVSKEVLGLSWVLRPLSNPLIIPVVVVRHLSPTSDLDT